MKRVVIVHRHQEQGDSCRSQLVAEGFEAITCSGPQAGQSVCHVIEDGSCPLCEASDLFVYDPWLESGRSEAIVATLRRRYAAKPVLFLGTSPEAPLGVARLAADDPGVGFAAADGVDLGEAIRRLCALGEDQCDRAPWSPSTHERDPGLYGAADCPYL